MTLAQHIGDTVTHRIPLRWLRAAFTPASGWFLIFTLKADKDDADEDAKIQKTTDLGLTHSTSHALVDFLHIDTAGDAEQDPVVPALSAGTYFWDIQAQNIADPTIIRTVATGSLILARSVTHGTETAVPTYVAGPGLSYDTQLVIYS